MFPKLLKNFKLLYAGQHYPIYEFYSGTFLEVGMWDHQVVKRSMDRVIKPLSK